MKWHGLAALLIVAPPLEAQRDTLRLVGGSGPLNAVAVTHRGYPAYPVAVLEAVGARVVEGKAYVTVLLFGDTLRFYPTWSFFAARGRLQRLSTPAYRHGGVFYIPGEFFTGWLPERHPDRVRRGGGTVSLLGDAAGRVAVERTGGAPHTGSGSREERKVAPDQIDDDEEEIAADQVEHVATSRWLGDVTSLEGGVSSIYDSNIDHLAVPNASIGSIARAALGIQTSRSDPIVQVQYGLGVYRFTNTDRWNRITHDVGVELRPPVSKSIRPSLAGELRLGSTTEDRERADQLILRPAIEFRLSRMNRLTLYGAQRARRFPDRPEANATNRFAGLRFRHDWRSGARWDVDGRYEVNDAERERSRYTQWAGRAGVRIPVTGRSSLTFGVRHGLRRHAERLVEVDGEEQARVDRRWEPAVSFSHRFLGDVFEVRLAYEFEHNQSNELDKTYRAHRMELTVRQRF